MKTQKNLTWKWLIMLLAFPTLVYSQTLYVPGGINGIGTSTTGRVGITTDAPLGILHINTVRPIIMDNNGGSGIYGEHIGFNMTVTTGSIPNTVTKLGGTTQQGGALITVDYTGNMAFQMYDAGTELVSTIDYVPQIVFTNTGKLSVNGAIEVGVDKIPIQETNFGYSATWKVLRLGLNQANRSLALNVDPLGITGSNFSGSGQILIGNNGILAPDNAGTNWMGVLRATGGKIYLGGSLSSGDLVGDGLVVSGGNVGIGTTTVPEKLTVNGKILAEEVQVVVDVPDYVFAKEYKLKTLSEVSKFINEHKHLPEVPSEKEVLDNCGQVSLGEMNMTLLKKIEELTLYAIEQENNIKEQDEVITELLKQNETILKRVTKLEKQ